MMWTFKQTLVTFLIFNHGLIIQGTVNFNNDLTYFTDRLATVIQLKCFQNANGTMNQRAIHEFFTFQSFWQFNFPPTKLNGDDYYKYCLSDVSDSIGRLNKFARYLAPCLDADEQYIPQFLVDSYGNYNHYMCKYYLAKDLEKERFAKCINTFEDPKIDPLVVCYEDSPIFGNHVKDPGSITITKLCLDLKNILLCTEEQFDQYCVNVDELKALRLYLLEHAREHCP